MPNRASVPRPRPLGEYLVMQVIGQYVPATEREQLLIVGYKP
jgi:hypothetical protein